MYRKLKKLKVYPNKKHNGKICIFEKQKAFLVASQPIKAGEEIYVSYGFDYWDYMLKLSNQQWLKS